MGHFERNDFRDNSPRTRVATRRLGNGVEMQVTLFEPEGREACVCTASVCWPDCEAADPQYASLGEFGTGEAAIAAANLIASEAEAEDPHVIFSIPGGKR